MGGNHAKHHGYGVSSPKRRTAKEGMFTPAVVVEDLWLRIKSCGMGECSEHSGMQRHTP